MSIFKDLTLTQIAERNAKLKADADFYRMHGHKRGCEPVAPPAPPPVPVRAPEAVTEGNKGHRNPSSSWQLIGGKKFYARSRWEVNYAHYLEFFKQRGEIKEWEYEPLTFWFEGIRRGVTNYTPDFRVTLKDGSIEYREVKGWMDPKSATKIKRMAKYHPNVKLRVIGADWFKKNSHTMSAVIPGWKKKK